MGGWGVGPGGLTREGAGLCSGTRILRAAVPPFAQTGLGANHGLALGSPTPQREAGQEVLFPAKSAH